MIPSEVRWKLELGGHPEELQGLAKMYGGQAGLGVRVWLEQGKCYLHAPAFEDMRDPAEVHDLGEVLAGLGRDTASGPG